MCPFVPSAVKEDQIYFSYLNEEKTEDYISKINLLVDDFKEKRDALNSSFLAHVILLSADFDIDRLIDIHFTCKVFCIRNYIMIGFTHKKNGASSLHNESYFPLRTQTPCLILRDLTSQDLLFLNPDQYSIRERKNFLLSFIDKFSKSKNLFDEKQVEIAKNILSGM